MSNAMQNSVQDLVLASLIDANSLGEDYDVRAEYFSLERREIFDLMVKVRKEKGEISRTILESIIANKEERIQEAYLQIFGTLSLSYEFLGKYVDQIKLSYNIQKLKTILTNHLYQVEEAITTSEDEYSFISNLQKEIDRIHNNDLALDVLTPREKMNKMYEIYSKGGDHHIPTKFDVIDRKIQGFFDGSFVVIGARPSVGKTSFAISLMKNMLENGFRVGFFSIEMSDNQIQQRLASQILSIPLKDIVAGKDPKKYGKTIKDFIDNFNFPFFVDSNPLSVGSLKFKLKKFKNTHELDIIFIDYLQLIGGDQQRYELVTKISQELKIVAKELNIPLVVLSQLSRGSEQTEDKIPNLSHLRESGSIEQDADMVILLYKEDDKKKKEDSAETQFEDSTVIVDVAKNRNGQTGKIRLKFEKQYARFRG